MGQSMGQSMGQQPHGQPFAQPFPQPFAPYPTSFGASLAPVPKSDKNRIVAGILNIVLPGVGRMYLGYSTVGVIQFLLMFIGVGYFWGIVDGLLMLTGNIKEDGYGRELA